MSLVPRPGEDHLRAAKELLLQKYNVGKKGSDFNRPLRYPPSGVSRLPRHCCSGGCPQKPGVWPRDHSPNPTPAVQCGRILKGASMYKLFLATVAPVALNAGGSACRRHPGQGQGPAADSIL